MRVLYISYDGALDPLGRAQVIPYLEGLSLCGHVFDLLSFEKPERFDIRKDREQLRERLSASGIRWHPLRYHKRFSIAATTYDVVRGLGACSVICHRHRIECVHARSYVAALMAWRTGLPFVFDMRGLYADERVESGAWKRSSPIYHLTKALEQRFLRSASAVVTLTQASFGLIEDMVRQAHGRAQVHVIPTCVDTERFRPSSAGRSFTLTYFGSIGTWYLTDEMLLFGRLALRKRAEARLRFVVNDGTDLIRQRAHALGIDSSRLEISSVKHEDVPQALVGSAATLQLIRPTFSKVASAATKFGESLALGIPAVVNAGVGDAAAIVLRERVGVVVERFDEAAYASALDSLEVLLADPETMQRCRNVAVKNFSLADGINAYDGIYRSLRR